MYTSPIRSSAIVVSTGAKSKSFISGLLRGFNWLFMDCWWMNGLWMRINVFLIPMHPSTFLGSTYCSMIHGINYLFTQCFGIHREWSSWYHDRLCTTQHHESQWKTSWRWCLGSSMYIYICIQLYSCQSRSSVPGWIWALVRKNACSHVTKIIVATTDKINK